MRTAPRKTRSARYAAMLAAAGASLCTLLVAPTTAFAQSAPAGSDAWSNVVAAARKEGKIVLYSAAANPLLARLKSGFEAANPGITLEFSRYSTGELLTKLAQERETGADGADVMIATDIAWAEERLKEGSVKAPVGPAAKAWPAKYLVGGAIPVLSLEPIVIAYNTSIVKVPINSYQDLLKPELKGKLGTLDLSATSIIAFYDWLEKTQGPDYLALHPAAIWLPLHRRRPRLVETVECGAGVHGLCHVTARASRLEWHRRVGQPAQEHRREPRCRQHRAVRSQALHAGSRQELHGKMEQPVQGPVNPRADESRAGTATYVAPIAPALSSM